MLQEPGRIREAEPAEELPRAGAGDVDGGQRHGAVEEIDLHAPGVDPVAHPHLGIPRPTGGEGQDEAILRLATDHAVVDDVAALVEEQGVARPPDPDARHVGGIETLQEVEGPRAGDDELAERAHVAQ